MTAPCGGGKRRPRGGGCGFCGAKMALQPIADAVHLVHGPIGCLGHTWDTRPTGSSGPQAHRTNFTTDLGERDIVCGGDRKLARAIDALVARHHAAAVFVYQTCVSALIGDDLVSVCQAATARLGRPVIPVDMPGFGGDAQYGGRAAADTLLNHVIGTREPDSLTATDINLIGEFNVAGEVWQITPLLERMGIRVLASIPGDGRYAAIAGAHRARAAISLCSRALGGLAAKMQARHGIPFVEGSFYGRANVSDTLRGISRLLASTGAPPDLPARAEALIRQEEARNAQRLQPYLDRLKGKRVLLATGGVKVWSLAAMLQDLGMEVIGTSVAKTSAPERCRAAALVGEDRLTDGLAPDLLRTGAADVVLSGWGWRFQARKAGLPWVEIGHERDAALGGYDGSVRLAAAIDAAIHHPLWNIVSAAPPWQHASTRHFGTVLPFVRAGGR